MIDWNLVVTIIIGIGFVARIISFLVSIYGETQWMEGYKAGKEDERKWGQAIRDALEEDDE